MTGDHRTDAARAATIGTSATGSTADPPRLTTLVLLTALSVLPVNVILPSLPNIAAEFEADVSLVSLSVAVYAVVTALTGIVAGALSDRYGRRPAALTSICLFIVASVGCALSTDIGSFLLFRAMQASISACFSVALVVVKETSAKGRAASRIGYLATGWAIAPMVGPLFGGVLDEIFGWRAIFAVLAILGAAVLALCLHGLRETAARSSGSKAGRLAAYGQLMRSTRFQAYTLCMACSMGTLYVFFGAAPSAVGGSLGGSSAALGLHMGMVPAGFILGSYLAGRHGSRRAPSSILIVARLLTCFGLLVGLGLSMSGATHALALFGPCMFIGIGNGLTMPAANAGVLSVRADLAGTAAGLAAAVTIGGAALVAFVASLLLGEAGAVSALFAMLLAPASLALAAAFWVAYAERREHPGPA